MVATIIVLISGIKFEVQSDKVPATHEVEQGHESLSWAHCSRLNKIPEWLLSGGRRKILVRPMGPGMTFELLVGSTNTSHAQDLDQ